MSLINRKRLINYPRIIAVIFAVVFITNAATRNGWRGGIGTFIGYDFLTFYAIGKIYLNDVGHLYDFLTQFQVEQSIVYPTSLGGGGNIFSYPPYVASVSSVLTLLPYSWAFLIWTISSIALTIAAVYWMHKKIVKQELSIAGLTFFQLLVIVLSFSPFVFGLNLGQNHAFTLFILAGIIVLTLSEKWFLAGIFTGLLIYKPHFVIGFVLLWIIWKKYKALAATLLISSLWILTVLVKYGIQPFIAYIEALPSLMTLPYGVGRFAEVTLFALFSTILPASAFRQIVGFNLIALLIFSAGLVWTGVKQRHHPVSARIPSLIFALLLPFLVAPHVLAHDMVILIPVLLLWTHLTNSRRPLYAAIIIYAGSLLLLFIAFPTGIALLALIPITLLVFILRDSLPIIISSDGIYSSIGENSTIN
jgi:hypothetical protein